MLRELDLIERFVRHGLSFFWNSKIPSIRKQAGKAACYEETQYFNTPSLHHSGCRLTIVSGGQTGADRAALNAQRPVATISFATVRPSFPVALPKLTRPKQPLTSHHVEDPNALAVKTIKDPAGRIDNLPVSRTTELGGDGSAFGVPFQLFDMFKDPLYETASGLGVVEGDIIRDHVQISQCWLGPDYLSHRAIRFFASPWGKVRPSSTARSPRAIPRSISSCL
jgi:hypothetical protein